MMKKGRLCYNSQISCPTNATAQKTAAGYNVRKRRENDMLTTEKSLWIEAKKFSRALSIVITYWILLNNSVALDVL